MDGPDRYMRGEDDLYAHFQTHGISWTTHTHPPLFTVEDSVALRGDLPGAHCKNMFLKDKKAQLWLVTCREDRKIRIRDLEKDIGAQKCSFGKPELLWTALGLRPGAVSPFGLINDTEHRVRFVLDQQLLSQTPFNAHPLQNEVTVAVETADLLRFAASTGHDPLMVDFDALEALQAARDAQTSPPGATG